MSLIWIVIIVSVMSEGFSISISTAVFDGGSIKMILIKEAQASMHVSISNKPATLLFKQLKRGENLLVILLTNFTEAKYIKIKDGTSTRKLFFQFLQTKLRHLFDLQNCLPITVNASYVKKMIRMHWWHDCQIFIFQICTSNPHTLRDLDFAIWKKLKTL